MQEKNELLDKVVARTQWGNRNGVTAIILGEQCGYPLGVIKSNSIKQAIDIDALILNGRKDEGIKYGFIDFVFDHKTGFIGLTFSKNLNPFGHDGIADALLTPGSTGSEARRGSIAGGRIAFLNGYFITTEWSGHYGDLWNERIIEHFQSTFFWSTKQPICHIKWKADASAADQASEDQASEAEKPATKFLVSCGFFALNDSVTKQYIKASTQLDKQTCDLIASYLPKK
ncbi:Uncharacterised protein [Legionella busanensis]|uniref:Bacterial toxin 43 domain-containing protein n=1 Tax=Legionella busanensis TaxID=190655 RepID=A0A378JHZ3_9GAMM|nr:polymorphic toxin type 43 domain-containing protein [Legionella busanensis]STX49963.1 Uncharacterised protein [Legionella busanensis]